MRILRASSSSGCRLAPLFTSRFHRYFSAAAFLAVTLAGGFTGAEEVRDESPPPISAPLFESPVAPTPIPASEPARKLQRREDLVVTATRTEQSAGDVPVSVTVVPRKEIERSPTRTFDDTLRTVVGLNLPLGNSNLIQPTTNNVSMRGLGGNRALVLLDGVPQNDAVAGYIHWNKIPLETVERVEVARGAASSLFGNYAMGGVVNIFTRRLEPGRVAADASYGSFNTTRLSTSVANGLGGGMSLGFFADYEKTDGYVRTLPAERGAIDIPSSSRTLNLMAKLEYGTSSGFETFLKGGVVDQYMGQGTPLSNNHQRNYDVAGGGSVPLGDSTLSATAFYQDVGYTLWGSSLVPGTGRDKEYNSASANQPGWDIGGSAEWSKPLAGPVRFVAFGLDIRRVAADQSFQSFNLSGQSTGLRTVQGHQLSGGFFGEASFLPDPRFEILLSARLDAWQNTGGREESTPGGITTYADRSATRFDPRLSLRWTLSDTVALRGAAYRAFHAPNLSDLYRSSIQRSLQTISNPDLGPETLVGGDVGVDLKAGLFTGQMNLFYNHVDGLVARRTLATTPILVVQPHNIGVARSEGLEFMGTFALAKTLSLEVGYAYTDSVITDNPSDPTLVGNRLPGVPRNAGSLSLNWASALGPALTFRSRAQSQRYGEDANLLVMDKHLIFDLFVSCPITKAFVIFASGENLLDRQYVSEVNIGRRLGQPRALFIGLRLRQPLVSPGVGGPKSR